jgi:hypothetical protein
MRRHGLTVDNLLSVELVTADAERVSVDAETEPELFWGLRGGGGNFGIATALEYRLHPVGPIVLGGPVFWPFADAPRVLRFLRDYVPEAPDELGITLAMMPAPPLPFMPVEQRGRPVIGLVLVWAGDVAAGERALVPLRRLGTPIADVVRPVPYVALQSMLDGGAPHGRHYYWKSHRLTTFSDAAIDVFVDRLESVTSPFAQINGWAMGGAVSDVAADATAVGGREVASTSASRSDGPRRTSTTSATARGRATAGRRCGARAPGSTRTSSPTRAPPESTRRTASASRGSPRLRTAGIRPTCSASTPTSRRARRPIDDRARDGRDRQHRT